MRQSRILRHTNNVLISHARLLKPSGYLQRFSTTAFRRRSDKWYLESNDFHPRDSPNPQAKHVAILGGGITGLTAAYELARAIPDVKITIFEQSDRLGGWLNSETIDVGDGEVLFEWGPRSLRFSGGRDAATVEMLLSLKLQKSIIGIFKNHPASQNRFIYYPDHLVRMPAPDPAKSRISNFVQNLYSFFNEPIFSGVLSGLFGELTTTVRPPSLRDESAGAFVRRRFGPSVADNLLSALFHGIYAGDVYKLSARTLLPRLWYAEARDPEGSGIITELGDIYMRGKNLVDYTDVRVPTMLSKTPYAKEMMQNENSAQDLVNLPLILSACSAYTFAEGLGTLPTAIEAVLRKNDNITIRTKSKVSTVSFNEGDNSLSVCTKKGESPSNFDYAISSLSPRALADWMSHSDTEESGKVNGSLPYQMSCLHAHESADVMVVNLYYSNPNVVPVRGFGYLLPQSISADQNPERALGVIFSSESSGVRGPGAVTSLKKMFSEGSRTQYVPDLHPKPPLSDRTGPVFKQFGAQKSPLLHQMAEKTKEQRQNTHGLEEDEEIRLGQDTAPGTKLTVMLGGHWWKDWAADDLPSETEAIEMAKNVLARHLQILEQPTVAKARLNRDAIPQYPVRYRDIMSSVHQGLMSMYRGRLKVAGPWWQGAVGVNDCIRSARDSVFAIREGWDDETGLKTYTQDEKWCLVDRRTEDVIPDPMCGSA